MINRELGFSKKYGVDREIILIQAGSPTRSRRKDLSRDATGNDEWSVGMVEYWSDGFLGKSPLTPLQRGEIS
jgi:hypothetical protein